MSIARGVALAAVAVAAVASLSGCGAAAERSNAQTSSGATLTALTNAAFQSTVSADLAGDEKHLWALVEGIAVGTRSRQYTNAVYEWHPAGWRKLPELPEPSDGGYTSAIVAWRSSPCVKYSRAGNRGEVIRCLRQRRWQTLPRRGALSKRDRIAEMATYDRTLVIRADTRAGVQVMQSSGGEWIRVGGLLKTRRASLGTEVEGRERRPTIGTFERLPGRRAIQRVSYVLRRNRWLAQEPLRGLSTGPSVSGPLAIASRIYVAHTQVKGSVWPFGVSILTAGQWRPVGGGPLARSSGASQGIVGYAGGRVWALWQDNVPTEGGFDTTISVVELRSLEIGRRTLLWQGLSNGPGSVQVMDAVGQGWMVYMPARAGGRGQREVVVEPLPPS